MNIVAVFCYKSIYYYIGIIKAAIYQFNLPPVFSLSKRKLLSFQVCFRVKIIGFGVPLYTQNASKKEQKSLQDKKRSPFFCSYVAMQPARTWLQPTLSSAVAKVALTTTSISSFNLELRE